MSEYATFLAGKRLVVPCTGVEVDPAKLHPALFPFQRDLVLWALRGGRRAIWADTGLGKTFQALEWGRHAADRCLTLAPLAVALQTVQEGKRWGIPIAYCHNQAEADALPSGTQAISNYERLHLFDGKRWPAVVLDESAILRNFSGTTKQALVEAFRDTPMRLCCTATPMPNDVVELCNHADFLGIMSPADMLSNFFISKGQDQKNSRFRLKNHARKGFFRWLASWAMALRRPSDLGYSDEGYDLPPLDIVSEIVPSDYRPADRLFFFGLQGVSDQAQVRRATLTARVAHTVEIVNAEPEQPWLVWCGLNAESDALARALPTAKVVQGSDTPEHKAETLVAFANGELPAIITKASIAGMGLNLQVCARQVFVGIGHSYDAYYQSIRRSWRFGQTKPVRVHIVLSEPEQEIYNNVLRKEREAGDLQAELIAAVAAYEREELASQAPTVDPYEPTRIPTLPAWLQSVALPAVQTQEVVSAT